MARYGVVAGEKANNIMKAMIENFEDMEVTYEPITMGKMINDITTTGGIQLQDLKAVLILDYAFNFGGTGDIDKIAEEFVAIQDLMRSNRMENITLYLVTRNTDLYDKLKGTVSGVPGIYFESVQVLLAREDYKAALIRSVLLGERDNMGLYNKEAKSQKSRKDRLIEEKKREMESRRNLREELLKYDKSEPTSTISEMDFIDSTKRELHEKNKLKEQEAERRKLEREQKRAKEPVPVEKEDIGINIYKGSGSSEGKEGPEEISDGGVVGGNTGLGSEDQQLHELFGRIRNTRSDVALGKIESDRGVISVVGDYNAGGSGIVANAAEMYAMSKRKVLIIDMDIQNRMQTVYFNQYDKVVSNQRGSSDSLIEVVQGYGIEDCVVPITSWLHILSVSRNDEIALNWVNAIEGNIETILLEAKGLYDVIILDIPFRLFRDYLSVFSKVDRNLFVVENKFYKVENFIENIIHPILLDNTVEVEELLSKSNIVLNKFRRGMRDTEGREINRRYMRRALDEIGYPYDNVGVAGEIPFYDMWENQFLTGLRHIWTDSVSLGVYRRVFGKVVI